MHLCKPPNLREFHYGLRGNIARNSLAVKVLKYLLLGNIVLVLKVLLVVNKLNLKNLFGLPLLQNSFVLTKQKLIPSALVVYNPSLEILTNYLYTAHNTIEDHDHNGISQPCNKFSSCSKHSNNPDMFKSTNFTINENDKKLFLTQCLTCDNYEIYAAQCKLCDQIYVGQTKNKFSIITTKTSLVLTQTFLNATTSYFCMNVVITVILIFAKANGSINQKLQ